MHAESMHAKQKGSLGEISVAKHLIACGYAVFTELGDLSRTDLIVLADNKPIKIQVKACTMKNGAISAKAEKAGPNYNFRYSIDDVDVFALYSLDTDEVFFLKSSEVLTDTSYFAIRLVDAKNNQKIGVNLAKDYKDFRRVLRGHTSCTQTDNAVGSDMVQTATEAIPASES